MSGESDTHVELVSNLANSVRMLHGSLGNLALFLDDQSIERQRPQRINGHLPDLYAEDVPRTFVVIGEAKTRGDLLTERSQIQLVSFFRYLALFDRAFFYLAVPILAKPTATALVRELTSEFASVNATILTVDGVS